MVLESNQCLVRNGVDGEWRGERHDVKNVGSGGVLCTRASPEQSLWPGASIRQPQPSVRIEQSAIGFVGSFGDGDPKLVSQLSRDFLHRRFVPATDENRSQGANIRI